MAEHAEKSFENFLKLSPNLRTRMINKMQPDDRCRFTRCSKLCSKEAKASKNYVYSISIFCISVDVIVSVNFDSLSGCYFSYSQHNGRKGKVCKTRNHQFLWGVELGNSINLLEYVIEEVENIFKSYQNSIRNLSLYDLSLRNLDIDIKQLSNLEKMNITGHNDIQKILSTLQKPLKNLCIAGVTDNIDCEQIYQVEQRLICLGAPLNNQQFLRISAMEIGIPVGNLTEKDIFKFIRSWQNGTIGKEIRNCRWVWKDSNFNKDKFARLLRLPERSSIVENAHIEFQFEIKHFKKPGKSALLRFTDQYLEFKKIMAIF